MDKAALEVLVDWIDEKIKAAALAGAARRPASLVDPAALEKILGRLFKN
jgi:hypothetical protein